MLVLIGRNLYSDADTQSIGSDAKIRHMIFTSARDGPAGGSAAIKTSANPSGSDASVFSSVDGDVAFAFRRDAAASASSIAAAAAIVSGATASGN